VTLGDIFGRNLVSKVEEIQPLSPVSVIGGIEGKKGKINSEGRAGEKITIEME
jgi:hypothetical protein